MIHWKPNLQILEPKFLKQRHTYMESDVDCAKIEKEKPKDMRKNKSSAVKGKINIVTL